ncbi:serine/arginine repetitive matrix protein 2-like [Ornithodoros turicata]
MEEPVMDDISLPHNVRVEDILASYFTKKLENNGTESISMDTEAEKTSRLKKSKKRKHRKKKKHRYKKSLPESDEDEKSSDEECWVEVTASTLKDVPPTETSIVPTPSSNMPDATPDLYTVKPPPAINVCSVNSVSDSEQPAVKVSSDAQEPLKQDSEARGTPKNPQNETEPVPTDNGPVAHFPATEKSLSEAGVDISLSSCDHKPAAAKDNSCPDKLKDRESSEKKENDFSDVAHSKGKDDRVKKRSSKERDNQRHNKSHGRRRDQEREGDHNRETHRDRSRSCERARNRRLHHSRSRSRQDRNLERSRRSRSYNRRPRSGSRDRRPRCGSRDRRPRSGSRDRRRRSGSRDRRPRTRSRDRPRSRSADRWRRNDGRRHSRSHSRRRSTSRQHSRTRDHRRSDSSDRHCSRSGSKRYIRSRSRQQTQNEEEKSSGGDRGQQTSGNQKPPHGDLTNTAQTKSVPAGKDSSNDNVGSGYESSVASKSVPSLPVGDATESVSVPVLEASIESIRDCTTLQESTLGDATGATLKNVAEVPTISFYPCPISALSTSSEVIRAGNSEINTIPHVPEANTLIGQQEPSECKLPSSLEVECIPLPEQVDAQDDNSSTPMDLCNSDEDLSHDKSDGTEISELCCEKDMSGKATTDHTALESNSQIATLDDMQVPIVAPNKEEQLQHDDYEVENVAEFSVVSPPLCPPGEPAYMAEDTPTQSADPLYQEGPVIAPAIMTETKAVAKDTSDEPVRNFVPMGTGLDYKLGLLSTFHQDDEAPPGTEPVRLPVPEHYGVAPPVVPEEMISTLIMSSGIGGEGDTSGTYGNKPVSETSANETKARVSEGENENREPEVQSSHKETSEKCKGESQRHHKKSHAARSRSRSRERKSRRSMSRSRRRSFGTRSTERKRRSRSRSRSKSRRKPSKKRSCERRSRRASRSRSCRRSRSRERELHSEQGKSECKDLTHGTEKELSPTRTEIKKSESPGWPSIAHQQVTVDCPGSLTEDFLQEKMESDETVAESRSSVVILEKSSIKMFGVNCQDVYEAAHHSDKLREMENIVPHDIKIKTEDSVSEACFAPEMSGGNADSSDTKQVIERDASLPITSIVSQDVEVQHYKCSDAEPAAPQESPAAEVKNEGPGNVNGGTDRDSPAKVECTASDQKSPQRIKKEGRGKRKKGARRDRSNSEGSSPRRTKRSKCRAPQKSRSRSRSQPKVQSVERQPKHRSRSREKARHRRGARRGRSKEKSRCSRSSTLSPKPRSRSRSLKRNSRNRGGIMHRRSRSRSLRHRGIDRMSRRRSQSIIRQRRKRSRSRSRPPSKNRSSLKPRSPSRKKSKSPVNHPGRAARASSVEKIDKAQLLEAARRNVKEMMEKGTLPRGLTISVTTTKLMTHPAAAEQPKIPTSSLADLTEFCKALSKEEEKEESGEADPKDSGDEPAFKIHHPFKVKDPPPIRINIPNATQLPVKTLAEKVAEAANLHKQFPVSSGNQHRIKELEWVPVEPEPCKEDAKVEKKQKVVRAKLDDTKSAASPPLSLPAPPSPPPLQQAGVFNPLPTVMMAPVFGTRTEQERPPVQVCAVAPMVVAQQGPAATSKLTSDGMDLCEIMSRRVEALRRLKENPMDMEAMHIFHECHKQFQAWAQSKQEPGQYTGTVDFKPLTPEELSGPFPAWVKKDQFAKAMPVLEGIGMHLLRKMGWNPGEGLGKNKEGALEPLLPNIKTDKKGLVSEEEVKRQVVPAVQELGGKHPVSALTEYCIKHRLGPPEFTLANESGPDHKKTFIFKVKVNGQEYQPVERSINKKHAKAQAALVCLQHLGIVAKNFTSGESAYLHSVEAGTPQ